MRTLVTKMSRNGPARATGPSSPGHALSPAMDGGLRARACVTQ